jgi:hypothetical protein
MKNLYYKIYHVIKEILYFILEPRDFCDQYSGEEGDDV